MAKKKKRRKLKPRTIWLLVTAYMIVGACWAIYYMNAHAPDPTLVEQGATPMGMGALFPVIIMLWPLFVVIHIIQVLL